MAEFSPSGALLQSKFTQTSKMEDQKDFAFWPVGMVDGVFAGCKPSLA